MSEAGSSDDGTDPSEDGVTDEELAEADEQDQHLSYGEILVREMDVGLTELNRPLDSLALSALSAGLDIGFGPLLMAVVLTAGAGVYEQPTVDILMANMYAVGFILVVLGRSELFTEHTTLAVLPVLDGRASLRDLGTVWTVIYVGNVVGGAIFALAMDPIVLAFGGVERSAFVEIATHMTDHGWYALVGAGVLAGWLMGLLSWLVSASQDTISQVFFVWLITTSIGLIGLPHCIAGNVEVLAGVVVTDRITLLEYGEFMSAATIGNVIGGTVFVALLNYSHVIRSGDLDI